VAGKVTVSGTGKVRSKATVVRATEKRELIVPPWIRLDYWLGLLLSRRIYAEIVRPILADAQIEYLDAMMLGDERKAKFVKWRCVASLILSAIYLLAQSTRDLFSWMFR
jgi:hypothetical protein